MTRRGPSESAGKGTRGATSAARTKTVARKKTAKKAPAGKAPAKKAGGKKTGGKKAASKPKASAPKRSSSGRIMSMTGYGKATLRSKHFSGSIEIRSFNHRHLKIALKVPAILSAYETKVEQIIRDRIARGSLSLTLKLVSRNRRAPFEFDEQVIAGYVASLRAIGEKCGIEGSPTLDLVSQLPETLVAIEASEAIGEADWRSLRGEIKTALDELLAMRATEGAKLEKDVIGHRNEISKRVSRIAKAAPGVVEGYRRKLLQRVSNLLAGEVEVSEADLAREIAVFADRCDISEELARLDSHLRQFDEIIEVGREAGRSLEFILHEMFREVNTIGSKANDSTISHLVVEIKAAIEKIREQVLNIE